MKKWYYRLPTEEFAWHGLLSLAELIADLEKTAYGGVAGRLVDLGIFMGQAEVELSNSGRTLFAWEDALHPDGYFILPPQDSGNGLDDIPICLVLSREPTKSTVLISPHELPYLAQYLME